VSETNTSDEKESPQINKAVERSGTPQTKKKAPKKKNTNSGLSKKR
jgi:hypothetical protein